MSVESLDVYIPLKWGENPEQQRKLIAQKLGISPKRIGGHRLVKKSIDARRRPISFQMRFEVALDEPLSEKAMPTKNYPTVSTHARRIVIVGSGPGGLFAALKCLELGMKPIVLERGKDVVARRFDLAPLLREGRVVEESNYCFGEGGAGTFSDGKLYTRATKRGPIQAVYETFVAHGAPPEILTDAHPHIGSNLLPNVVREMRESILAAGGEVHFNAKVTRLLRSLDGTVLRGVGLENGAEFLGDAVILATGHSARDIYRLLHREGLRLEQKPFAVGVRIEHAQSIIDEAQYHLKQGAPRPDLLPAARYVLATKVADRGVHSFCMCPGGFIVPAATENDEVVVNGMSLSRRNSPFANSGLVVTVEPEDTRLFEQEHGVLAGLAYQKALEIASSQAGGGKQKAPAQRVSDFLNKRMSSSLGATSYHPGLTAVPLHELLPYDVAWRMAEGLVQFAKKIRGFTSSEAMLIGCETRTSSPLRIPRDTETLHHPELRGLIPCGEGAGFAGGIVSAALDGMRCAEAAALQY